MTFYDSSAFFRGKSTNVEGLYSILIFYSVPRFT